MFTNEEIEMVALCRDDQSFDDREKGILENVVNKMTGILIVNKPEIIVTIEDSCYQYSNANTDMTVIIEDKDYIKNGGDLFYTAPSTEDYDIVLRKAKVSARHPKEVRIFVHDPEDKFPYQVMTDGEVIQTLETMQDALTYLQTRIG